MRSSADQLHNVAAAEDRRAATSCSEVVWTPPAAADMSTSSAGSASPSGASAMQDGAPVVVLAHRLYRRARLRDLLPSAGRTRPSSTRSGRPGEPHGLMPLGLQGARHACASRAGLIFAGYEFCDQTDPFEAGHRLHVPLASKNEDFVGRDAPPAAEGAPAEEACRSRDARRKNGRPRRLRAYWPRPDRRGHQRASLANPARKSHRARTDLDVSAHAGARHRGRGRVSSTANKSACQRSSCASRITTPEEDAGACVVQVDSRQFLLDLAGVVYRGEQPLP